MSSKTLPSKKPFENPFRPGAGHPPPHLAGRDDAIAEFEGLLKQTVILQNVILRGLRGTGKTVLLNAVRPIATREGWVWAGRELSKGATITEQTLAVRILSDLAPRTSLFAMPSGHAPLGFKPIADEGQVIGYDYLLAMYEATHGLSSDKLECVLRFVTGVLTSHGAKGLVLAYDEAQFLCTEVNNNQFPLSVLLSVIQSMQKEGIPIFLVLSGLPMLYPKLLETVAHAERMFHVITIDKLSRESSKEAILVPLKAAQTLRFSPDAIDRIIEASGGYPYFIQFLCKEAVDIYLEQLPQSGTPPTVHFDEIVRKLDEDFYHARWYNLTDRQRDFLHIVALLPNANEEFTANDILEHQGNVTGVRKFKQNHVAQMFAALASVDVLYKKRYAKYGFAVPLLGDYIKRQKRLHA